ncbi:NADAR_family protein [Hexamita inflata]|uniref:NADAR family protein n=1 Tax=Hexamita inflata TaxID=28002 RepID=A0AA86NNW6_9EUKA|nr:NADAR family protein [Hexamita inflata]
MNIDSFRGEHAFLSNFYECQLTYNNFTYLNVEAAFQAQKCPGSESRFTNLLPSPAKKLGRKVDLRPDWEKVKVQIMREILKIKFQNEELKEKLKATKEAELIEGNTWGDTFWGVSRGNGKNMLGKLLMEIRKEL